MAEAKTAAPDTKPKAPATAPPRENPFKDAVAPDAILGGAEFNQERALEQRAALKAHAVRNTDPTKWKTVPGPNGEVLRVAAGATFKMPGATETMLASDPYIILKKPLPPWDYDPEKYGPWMDRVQTFRPHSPHTLAIVPSLMPRYVWMIREEPFPSTGARRNRVTETHERSSRVRYVMASEVDRDSRFATYDPLPTADGQDDYVTLRSQILVEIMDPQLAYDLHQAWVDMAAARVLGLPQELPTAPTVATDIATPAGDGRGFAAAPSGNQSLATGSPGRAGNVMTEFGADPRRRSEEPGLR